MSLNGPMRTLITGASGFVGDHLVRKLKAILPADSRLVLADRNVRGNADPADCTSIHLDITDASEVNRVIQGEQPTHILHLAAIAAVTAANRDIRPAWNVNFSGTQNIALAICEFVPDCRLLYCSSAQVYGASFKSNAALDETALLQPVNPYGAAKAAADIMLSQMALSGLRVLRLRPFNHTGPGQNTQFVIPAFAAQIAKIERGEQEPVIRIGDLRSRRDFLDVHDVVDAYTEALLRFDGLPNGAAINIASGEAHAIQDALDILVALSQVRIDVAVDAALLRPNDTPVVLGNANRARDWLGWTPKRTWNTTLESVLNYWRQHPC
jgi:GDP-4-dehydro-6-deoxy-D-mannose reductase